MACIYQIVGNLILVEESGVEATTKLPLHIPCALLWEINQCLSNHFELYALTSQMTNGALEIIPRRLYRVALPDQYIFAPKDPEKFLLEEYSAYKKYGISFDFFKKIYTLGMKERIQYCALTDWDKGKKILSACYKKTGSKWSFTSVNDLVLVDVQIEPSVVMIFIKEKRIMDLIVNILQKHAVKKENVDIRN